ncbi:MAG: translocation/assembly module TamB domain-containing protein [Crocinitomicaceae bacterium]|nr:translocation/assembly module TamB domain-containing protein [Crocinitomicaceae bacterium]
MTKVLKIAGLSLAILLEWLLILVIFLVFAIRSSWVQTYIAGQATSFLSKELNAKVQIGAVDIVLFRYIDLKDIYLEDPNQQKVLALKHLYLGLDQFKLLQNKLLINELRLYSGEVHLALSKEDGAANIDFLVNYFSSDTPSKSSKPFEVQLEKLSLEHLHFSYHDLRKDTLSFGLDYDHIELKNLSLKATQIQSVGESFKCQIRQLQFKDRSGFELRQLSAFASFSANGLVLKNAALRTPNSVVSIPKLALRTKTSSDFNDFDDRVVFDGILAPSRIWLHDIAYFAPDIQGMDQTVFLSGVVKDKLRNLRIQDLNLRFGKRSQIQANLRLPDFRKPTAQLWLDETITKAYLDLKDVQQLHLPTGQGAIEIPEMLQKAAFVSLQNAKLSGTPSNLQVAIDKAQTALGELAVAPITIANTPDLLTISGVSNSNFLKLHQFELGQLLDISEIGKLSCTTQFKLSFDNDGELTLQNASALLSQLELNNYNYTGIAIQEAKIQADQLIAKLDIDDPHLQMNSILQLGLGAAPSYQVQAEIVSADLSALHLSSLANDQLSARVNIGFEGPSWKSVVGFASLRDLRYSSQGHQIYSELAQVHYRQQDNYSNIDLSSPILDFNIEGVLDEQTLVADLTHHLAILYPPIEGQAREFKHSNAQFEFSLLARNTRELLNIFLPELELAPATSITGSFNSKMEELKLGLTCSRLAYTNFEFENIKLNQTIFHDQANGQLDVSQLFVSDSTSFHELKLVNSGANGVVDAVLSWDPNTNDFSELKWRTTILPNDYVSFTLQPSFFTVNGVEWKVANQSDITVAAKDVSINDFELHRGYQRIKINGCLSENKRDQLRFDVIGLDLGELSSLMGLPNQYSGRFSGWGTLATPFTNLSIAADANLEQLQIDGQAVGDIMLHSDWNDARESIVLEGTLQYRNERTFDFDGLYKLKEDELDLGLNFKQTDISFVNAFLDPEVVKGIKGKLNGRLGLTGSPDEPKLKGKLRLQEGGAEVAILGVNYQLEGLIQVTEDAFFLDNIPVKDPEGNTAYLSSAINHTHFDRWNYDIQINFEDDIKKIDPRTNQVVPIDKFLVLNTKQKEGDVYYGKAYGRGTANIFGTMTNTEITVDATTRKGTEVIFPMYGMSEIDDEDNFVQFVEHGVNEQLAQQGLDFTGLYLDLNFHVTPDAGMKLIFNEQTGDEIIAKGSGDLNIKLDQYNQLTMNGPYVISKGSRYYFALGSIKQTFDIEAGSKIEWTGDPYNADITINTVTAKRASILELSPEIQDNTLVNQEILCYLKLSESLLAPKITFDLVAPRVTETGKALIDRVKSDPDELNRQFFSLLLVSKFQPLKGNLSAGGSAALDLLESQINAALGKLSDNYKLNVDYGADAAAGESKVELGVAKGFLDDKLVITGSFGVENRSAAANGSQAYTNSMIGDVNIEYKIQDNFRVRAFNQSNTNSVNENQGPFTQGFGVSYYEEFHRFSDLAFVKQLKQLLTKSSKKSGQPQPKKHRQPVTLPQDEKSTSSQSRRDRSTRA